MPICLALHRHSSSHVERHDTTRTSYCICIYWSHKCNNHQLWKRGILGYTSLEDRCLELTQDISCNQYNQGLTKNDKKKKWNGNVFLWQELRFFFLLWFVCQALVLLMIPQVFILYTSHRHIPKCLSLNIFFSCGVVAYARLSRHVLIMFKNKLACH